MPDPAILSPQDRQQRRQQLAQMARRPVRLLGESILALVELACARWALSRLTVAEIERRNRLAEGAVGGGPQMGDSLLVDRVALIMSLAAWRVPWRSDCLVQALAAQRWLYAKGVASRIVIGADITGKEGFLAHAWLLAGDRIITGGEIDRYTVLFGSPEQSGGM